MVKFVSEPVKPLNLAQTYSNNLNSCKFLYPIQQAREICADFVSFFARYIKTCDPLW